MSTNRFANTQHIQGGISEIVNLPMGDVTECSDDCIINTGTPTTIIFISKYMIKKYGFNEAAIRIINRKNKIKKV